MPQGEISSGEEVIVSVWRSPSNIALIKYWGKSGHQIPSNPSLSFTLSEAYSTTKISRSFSSNGLKTRFLFEGVEKPEFGLRIHKYLEGISGELEFLKQSELLIESTNSFPHSTGIASSASSMSALALCLCSIEEQLKGQTKVASAFFERASYFARLGSGSACRSVYGGLALWGHHEGVPESSDLYAIPFNNSVHDNFIDYQDTILIVDSSPKEVSSTFGHGLMKGHAFSADRIRQAGKNMSELIAALESGNEEDFVRIVENEAMTLHALMMSSIPYYSLLKQNTWEIIKKIRDYREQNNHNICFTLDAGPNVHLLYPASLKQEVGAFVKGVLLEFCEKESYLSDKVGTGPKKTDI